MKKQAKKRILVSPGGTREMLTVTVSPHTRDRLDALCGETCLSRGQVVDYALMRVRTCDTCDGTGSVDGELGPETEQCPACRGARLT